MKLLNRGLALAVVGAGLAALPTIGVQAAPAAAGRPARRSNGRPGQWRRSPSRVPGSRPSKVGFVRVTGDGDLHAGPQGNSPRRGEATRPTPTSTSTPPPSAPVPASSSAAGTAKSAAGWTVTFTQSYQGVAVFGVDAHGARRQAGRPDLGQRLRRARPLARPSTPRISAAEPRKRASAWSRRGPPAHEDGETADLTGIAPKASRAGRLPHGCHPRHRRQGHPRLRRRGHEREERPRRPSSSTRRPASRSTAGRWSRRAQTASSTRPPAPPQAPVLHPGVEGGRPDPSPSTTDQENLVDSAGESYWLFRNTFGRDSYDGDGGDDAHGQQRPAASAAPTPTGTASPPTTATASPPTTSSSHEWGHAYTEYTSGLIYQWQSGALNESYSDVWGETLDLLNGREDEGEDVHDEARRSATAT